MLRMDFTWQQVVSSLITLFEFSAGLAFEQMINLTEAHVVLLVRYFDNEDASYRLICHRFCSDVCLRLSEFLRLNFLVELLVDAVGSRFHTAFFVILVAFHPIRKHAGSNQ